MKPHEYDGFYFLPPYEEEQVEECDMKFVFFRLPEEYTSNEKIGNNSMGDQYHIAFFRETDELDYEFVESFDAILSDPYVYATNLCGTKLYGCILRKTNKSEGWFIDYIKRTLRYILVGKLIDYADQRS